MEYLIVALKFWSSDFFGIGVNLRIIIQPQYSRWSWWNVRQPHIRELSGQQRWDAEALAVGSLAGSSTLVGGFHVTDE